MARSGMRALCLAIAAAALLSRVGKLSCFVPGPLHRSIAPAAGGSAAALFAPAAFADVNWAAKKLADLSYPMVKATDWATTGVLDKYVASVPTTKEFSKAILELSVSLDPKLVKDAVQAHKKAVEAMGPNFVTPLKNHEEVKNDNLKLKEQLARHEKCMAIITKHVVAATGAPLADR